MHEDAEVSPGDFAAISDRGDLIPTVLDTNIEQPITREYTKQDGIGIVQIEIQLAGTYVPQHSHEYAHATLVTSGGIRVWKDGELDQDYLAPTIIEVPARMKHTFMSLANNTVLYCIHNVSRTGYVEIHERYEFGLHPDDEVI